MIVYIDDHVYIQGINREDIATGLLADNKEIRKKLALRGAILVVSDKLTLGEKTRPVIKGNAYIITEIFFSVDGESEVEAICFVRKIGDNRI